MLRLVLGFSVLVIAGSWLAVSRGGDALLHDFASWAVSGPDETVVASVDTFDDEPKRAVTPLGRKVSMQADMKGQFEGQFRINGRTVTAMVDTGATLVAMNVSTAAKAGIRLRPADFRHEVQTANGRTRAASAVIDSLEIGRIHVTNVEAVILDDDALKSTLIGMSFLRRLGKYQVENHTLLLVQ